MSGSRVPGQTAAVCSAGGIVALLAFTAFGHSLAGLAFGVGLALGGLNGLLAAGSVGMLGSFRFLSLMRLGLLSTVALGVGLLLQPAVAWLTVAGVAVSQFVMLAVAVRSVLR